MVTSLVILLLVWLYGYWFVYMVIGLVINVIGLVIWLLVLLYGYWFCYMVIDLVIWLLVWLNVY